MTEVPHSLQENLLASRLLQSVQRLRHTDIRTTMNLYGDVVTDEMAEAHSKVVSLALATRESNQQIAKWIAGQASA
jgi:integrase